MALSSSSGTYAKQWQASGCGPILGNTIALFSGRPICELNTTVQLAVLLRCVGRRPLQSRTDRVIGASLDQPPNMVSPRGNIPDP
jgi:hypothetical protein